MTYPELKPVWMIPPSPDVVRSVPGLEPLADLIEVWQSASRDVQAAADAYRAVLPPAGDSWLAAKDDAKKATAVLGRIDARYGDWSAAVAAADVAALECARFRDSKGAAGRENDARLKALDVFLCSLPGSWDVEDDAALVARGEAKREADRLRRSLWAAHRVASWLALPSRLGLMALTADHGELSLRTVNGWPLPSLSMVAVERLNILLCTGWAVGY